jgi:bifunctional DNA-binding transcriptional regulator/antitoxin component of YhaV-PrlF toxin-antitoxin module
MTTVQADERGAVSIPAELLREIGIQPQQPVLVEKMGRFIRIYGSDDDVEIYTPERKAEFLLNSAVDEADYAEAVKAVRALGLDPDRIQHDRPASV